MQDDTRNSKNHFVYYEMIKEKDNSDSSDDKPPTNMLFLNHDQKSSSQSMASYQSSSVNKFATIGDYGYISPIIAKQNTNTDNNSQASEDIDMHRQL